MTFSQAVFLDRDGTIIFDGNYISHPSEVRLLPGSAEALALLRTANFKLFLFTNQSGVGRGKFPIDCVHLCNERMLELLGLGPALFTDICIATESPDQPVVYRKPNPRFINESVEKHVLDRMRSWMVGDKLIDAEAGLNAGIGAALIGSHPHEALPNVQRFPSLFAFARALVDQP